MKFDLIFLDKLQAILAAFDSVSLESGPRSVLHNKAIGGKRRSAHISGQAADLIFDTPAALRLGAQLAINLGCTGVEVDLGNYHLHIDTKERNVAWHVVRNKNDAETSLLDWLASSSSI